MSRTAIQQSLTLMSSMRYRLKLRDEKSSAGHVLATARYRQNLSAVIAVAFSVPRSGAPIRSTAEPSGGATTSIRARLSAQHLMSLKKM